MMSGNPNLKIYNYAQMSDLVEAFKKIFTADYIKQQ